MTYQHIIESLDCSIFHEGDEFAESEIRDVVTSDLMSDVLLADTEDFILVTSLSSDQVIRTADIVSARGVLLVNGKKPQAGMLKLAKDHGLTLLGTSSRTFPACVALARLLEQC
ncbi:MAG: hypothetical protein K9L68_11835 [Spirochaetales bacterium]|nr:hypothetical protein [Spirochaetales bacterium]MCF7939280.1 hypothetical protein [Spirochaetales bacterium]